MCVNFIFFGPIRRYRAIFFLPPCVNLDAFGIETDLLCEGRAVDEFI